jgi:hypothetical protein
MRILSIVFILSSAAGVPPWLMVHAYSPVSAAYLTRALRRSIDGHDDELGSNEHPRS